MTDRNTLDRAELLTFHFIKLSWEDLQQPVPLVSETRLASANTLQSSFLTERGLKTDFYNLDRFLNSK